ncbi:hypothetical protein [Adhaeribacter pallidiroseus]|uniref:hypothetical protein n=1 Tax=Adhaeribacter pallidiroseus TaxID=2072847 RepID=UPI001314656C|nr:hypothetical protein [Adhaeribacter pallidiroseus]
MFPKLALHPLQAYIHYWQAVFRIPERVLSGGGAWTEMKARTAKPSVNDNRLFPN